MGLDMYLSRSVYVGGWDHYPEEKKEQFLKLLAALDVPVDAVAAEAPSATVDYHVMYWRKANSIHKWFVDLDGGRDECQKIAVSREKLLDLLDLAKESLDRHKEGKHEQAMDLLPGVSGFFFGNVGSSDWHMSDMETTVKGLQNVLDHSPEDADFIYQASW